MPDIFGKLLTIFLFAVASPAFVFNLFQRWLDDAKSREHIAVWLRWPFRQRYLLTLEKGLDWLDGFIGKPISFLSFKWSLTVAIFYPIFFTLLAWFISNQAYQIENILLLKSTPFLQRTIVISTFVAIPILVYTLESKLDHWFIGINTYMLVNHRTTRRLLAWLAWISLLAWYITTEGNASPLTTIFIIIAFPAMVLAYGQSSIAPLVIGITISTVTDAIPLVILTVLTSFMISSVLVVAFGAGVDIRNPNDASFAGPFVVLIALALAWAISPILLVFILILPTLNALMDFTSLVISRLLSRRIASGEKWHLVVIHLLSDIVLAFAFLAILAFILPFGLEFINQLTGQTIVNWQEYVELAHTEPFGAGFMVTAMLLSTLVPTALHLLLALASFCLPIFPWHNWLYESIKAPKKSSLRVSRESFVLLSSTVATLFIVCVSFWGIWKLLSLHGFVGNKLYELAFWAGRLAGS